MLNPKLKLNVITKTRNGDGNFPVIGFYEEGSFHRPSWKEKKRMYYLGIDVGSVSTDIVLIDENKHVVEKMYLRTMGRPIEVIQKAFKKLSEKYGGEKGWFKRGGRGIQRCCSMCRLWRNKNWDCSWRDGEI